MLHSDKENFEQVILKVASETGIEPSIIEKDYYVPQKCFLKMCLMLPQLRLYRKLLNISCFKNIFSRFMYCNTDNY